MQPREMKSLAPACLCQVWCREMYRRNAYQLKWLEALQLQSDVIPHKLFYSHDAFFLFAETAAHAGVEEGGGGLMMQISDLG